MESEPKKMIPEAHRRSPLEFLNSVTGGRSLRYTLTRENLIDLLKTMAGVIPLTLLIWIYAEQEQIVYPNSPNANNIEVNFSKNARLSIEPVGASPPIVNLKLSGPQEEIEQVKQKLYSAIPQGVLIDTSDMLSGQNQPINIVDRIQNDPRFKSAGVTVLESQPKDILVNIDDMTSIKGIPVEIDPRDAANVSARFDPVKVTVEGPKRLLDQQTRDHTLHVYADLSQVTRNTTGQQPPQQVPLRLGAADVRMTIDPLKVNATLVLQSSDVTATIDYFPLTVNAPNSLLKAFEITINSGDDTTVGNITITGPAEIVDQIKNHKLKPFPQAVIDITQSDLTRQDPKKVRYEGLPPGVQVTRESLQKTLPFTITARPAKPDGG